MRMEVLKKNLVLILGQFFCWEHDSPQYNQALQLSKQQPLFLRWLQIILSHFEFLISDTATPRCWKSFSHMASYFSTQRWAHSICFLSVILSIHWWLWLHIYPGASGVFISKESLATYFSLSQQQQQFQHLACTTEQHYFLWELCQLYTALSLSWFHLWDRGLKKQFSVTFISTVGALGRHNKACGGNFLLFDRI